MSIISDAELQALACEFDMGPEPLPMGRPRWYVTQL